MPSTVHILIGADLVPTPSNFREFQEADLGALAGTELTELLWEADFRIFNLETPLTDEQHPIAKCGPNLSAPTAAVRGIRAFRPSLLTLANNHILDQGAAGLASTMCVLRRHQIPFVGAGKDLAEAAKPRILQKNGLKIGVYACAEHEFSIAGEQKPGANPYDPLECYDHVTALKSLCDYVIVLYHGGKEYYRYPSPQLQKYCRKFIEKGAALVVCQHSHCIGCREHYRNGQIVYGQGNFLFDHSEHECWQTSILLDAAFIPGEPQAQIRPIPLRKRGKAVRMAQGRDAEDILTGFDTRSREIQNGTFLRSQYQKFARESLPSMLYRFQSRPGLRLLQLLRRLGGEKAVNRYLQNELLSPKGLAMRNVAECEAWRELFIAALSQ